MKKFLFFLLISFLFVEETEAQFSRYIIQFKNKAVTTHSLGAPEAYLSQRAIERRSRYHIAIDSTDLPVPLNYIEQVKSIPNVTILNVSRWLNAIAIQTSDASAITAINALPFVQSSSPVAARPFSGLKNKLTEDISPLPATAARPGQIQSNYFDYGSNSFNEIHLHNGEFLHNAGLRGQGLQLAILDGGFLNYTTLKAFDSVNANGQVLSTWDFVARQTSVVEDHPHGMQCLSIIAANIPGVFIGKAPKASFHLFRTEDVSSEYPIEEFNWACGAERADSIGADIISSSLGYGYQFSDPVPDYPYGSLNGDNTMSAIAADLAAKKGLLVFNAAGNAGNDYWRMITTPADGDSVVAVGAVSNAGVVGSFSSYGPSADGRVKPDVASVGVATMVQTTGNTIATGNGTSFACPNMAGLATCLWQGFPEVNNMRIVRALKEAGNTFSAPNDRTGYGIPDLKKAFATLLSEFAVSTATVNNCVVQLNWTSKDVTGMKYEIERKAPGDTGYNRVATIDAQAGDVLANHQYQLNDPLNDLIVGVISYRIRQIIDVAPAASTAVYIDTTEVTVNAACLNNNFSISVVPNPALGSSSLVIETGYAISRMTLLVYDIKGALVTRLNESKPAGRAIVNLTVQQLSKGQYIIRVMDGNKELGQTRFLKL